MRNSLFAVFALLGLLSCRKEPTTWSADVSAPLFRGDLGLNRMIPDSLLSEGANGLWHLIYSQNLTDLNIDSLVNISDTTFSQAFEVPFSSGTIALPAGTSIIDMEREIELNGGGAQLRLIRMKSGMMTYRVKNYINGHMSSVFQMPGVTHDGVPVQIEATTLPFSGGIPGEASGSLDLTGYEIELGGLSGQSVNAIASSIAVSVSPDAPVNAIVHGQDSVVVELTFQDAVIEYGLGYFGQHQYALNEYIDFFEQIPDASGSLQLEQARMNLSVRNYIGVDARIRFDQVNSITPENSLNLSYAPFYQNMNITRALDMDGSVWPVQVEYEVNETNSNITQWIGQLPRALQLTGNVEINPLGNVSGSNDFIYTDQPLQARLDVDIPLRIGTAGLALQDTVEVSGEFDEDFFGHLIMIMENGFPLDAEVQLSLFDPSGSSSYVVAEDQHMAAGIPGDTDGEVTPVRSKIHIPVNNEVLTRLRNKNRMIIRVNFSTPPGAGFYGLYSHYRIKYTAMLEGTYGVSIE